jgi:hypothetical protein
MYSSQKEKEFVQKSGMMRNIKTPVESFSGKQPQRCAMPPTTGSSFMFINEVCTLMCDDIRIENTNKLILIGLYTPNPATPIPIIGVRGLPLSIPSLTFFQLLDTDMNETRTFQARIEHLDTGRMAAPVLNGQIQLAPGRVPNLIKFTGISITKEGQYSMVLDISDHPTKVTSSFDVKLF